MKTIDDGAKEAIKLDLVSQGQLKIESYIRVHKP